MTTSETSRSSGPGAPLAGAVVVTLAWHAVLFAAAFGLPPLAPSEFPDLGATVVNLIALLVPLAVVARRRWWSRTWIRFGRPRRALLLLPVLLVNLSYGLAGIEGSAPVLVSTAVLFLVLGFSEELLSRGVVQEFLDPWSPRARVAGVGVLFGLGHALSAVVFGRPLDDSIAQVISTTAFGMGFAALRLHIGVVWPLALLHGFDNWMQVNSPGAAPWGWQLLVALGYLGAAWALTRPSALPAPDLRDTARMSG